jgi:hypothetical protein
MMSSRPLSEEKEKKEVNHPQHLQTLSAIYQTTVCPGLPALAVLHILSSYVQSLKRIYPHKCTFPTIVLNEVAVTKRRVGVPRQQQKLATIFEEKFTGM